MSGAPIAGAGAAALRPPRVAVPENPDGMLAAGNPDVSCRPDAPTADPSLERVTPI